MEGYEYGIELEVSDTGANVTVNGFPTETETLTSGWQALALMLKHFDAIKERVEEVKSTFA